MPEDRTETYVRYDKTTGAVLGTYSVVYVQPPAPTQTSGTGAPLHEPGAGPAPVRPALDDKIINEALGLPPAHVDLDSVRILRVSEALGQSQNGFWVDDATQGVTERVPLRMTSERAAIVGDGIDAVEIEIVATYGDGNTLDAFQGDVRVTTSAGRLSEPGGRIRIREGRGSIVLTSTAETKASVAVSARDESGRFAPGSITLEFL